MIKIAIFASGSGSNAEQIIRYFENKHDINVSLILTNNPRAYVIERAKKLQVDYKIFTRDEFYNSDTVVDTLLHRNVDFIVLAGFLWLIPENLINRYPNRIVNIHPALLPSYGGKGMYGRKVHEAVLQAKDRETGITIHFVNNKYDEGDIIFQARCPVGEDVTPDDIQQAVHELEHKYFPVIIEKTIRQTFKI